MALEIEGTKNYSQPQPNKEQDVKDLFNQLDEILSFNGSRISYEEDKGALKTTATYEYPTGAVNLEVSFPYDIVLNGSLSGWVQIMGDRKLQQPDSELVRNVRDFFEKSGMEVIEAETKGTQMEAETKETLIIRGNRMEVYRKIAEFLDEEVNILYPGSLDIIGQLNPARDHLITAADELQEEGRAEEDETEWG